MSIRNKFVFYIAVEFLISDPKTISYAKHLFNSLPRKTEKMARQILIESVMKARKNVHPTDARHLVDTFMICVEEHEQKEKCPVLGRDLYRLSRKIEVKKRHTHRYEHKIPNDLI